MLIVKYGRDMLISALPTFNRFAGRLGLQRDYREYSVKEWTLHPGCSRVDPPCLFEAADLSRVTGYGTSSSAEYEEHRVHGGRIEHGPCRAYVLNDVTLLQGHLFRPGMTMHLSDGPVPWTGRAPTIERNQAVLASTHFGFKYFGHWVCDDLPLRLAARELGDAITWNQPQTAHQAYYARRLDLEIEALGETLFRELIVLDDVGQNRYKRERWEDMRSVLHGGEPVVSHPGVMYLRGVVGEKRVLINELEVADALRGRGFRIADTGRHSAEELVELGRGARVVVGVEGSQNAHGLLAVADGGTMIALQPPNRFNNVYKDRCDCLGLRYGFSVGHAGPDGGFTIDIGALHRLLDRIPAH